MPSLIDRHRKYLAWRFYIFLNHIWLRFFDCGWRLNPYTFTKIPFWLRSGTAGDVRCESSRRRNGWCLWWSLLEAQMTSSCSVLWSFTIQPLTLILFLSHSLANHVLLFHVSVLKISTDSSFKCISFSPQICWSVLLALVKLWPTGEIFLDLKYIIKIHHNSKHLFWSS